MTITTTPAAQDSGTVTALAVVGMVFGLLGLFGSFIPCFGMLAVWICLPAAATSGAAVLIARKTKAKQTFAIASLTISVIGVVISAIQIAVVGSAMTGLHKYDAERRRAPVSAQ